MKNGKVGEEVEALAKHACHQVLANRQFCKSQGITWVRGVITHVVGAGTGRKFTAKWHFDRLPPSDVSSRSLRRVDVLADYDDSIIADFYNESSASEDSDAEETAMDVTEEDMTKFSAGWEKCA